MNRLCAIYVVWADAIELLPYSINEINKVVDGVIII